MLNFIGPNIGVCVGVVTCEQAFTLEDLRVSLNPPPTPPPPHPR